MRRGRAAVSAVLLLGCAPVAAGDWTLQGFLGAPLNFPMPLGISQSGQPDIHLTARYDTHPFELPLYLGAQLAHRTGNTDWAIEYLHHKLYLSNPPAEVQSFAISHGYNLFAVNRGFRLRSGLWARAGAGPVITHPESTVRGRKWPETGGLFGLGYRLSGATLVGTLEQRLPLAAGFHLVLAGKLTAAYAVVPVEGGNATVPNVALHAIAGIGYGPAD